MWDGALYQIDSWVILKGSPMQTEAYKFLDFVGEAENQAKLPSYIAYGISNKAANGMVDPKAVADMPTSEAKHGQRAPGRHRFLAGEHRSPERALQQVGGQVGSSRIMDGLATPMTEAPASSAPAATGQLRHQLRRAGRMRRLGALALVAPLLLFVLLTFAMPIAGMLWKSVDDRDVARIMPRTVAALAGWQGGGLPDAAAFRALAADLAEARRQETLPTAARRLNYDVNGFRTLTFATARRLPPADAPDIIERFVALDSRWGEIESWAAIKRASGPLTSFYLLAAVDLHRDAAGSVVAVPADQAIYRDVLLRTFRTSLTVTLLCLALGFPLAYVLVSEPPRRANLLMILVLLPFWTSLLVRTSAWVVLLQSEGLVNRLMIWLGLIEAPMRLIYNTVGVHVAMTHVLLPFMILPLYSTMKAIPPAYMRAAAGLGAPPAVAFTRVYLPQCLPGIAAGCLLVFILAIGYYISPALVGGAADQMISYFIAFYVSDSVNWGMASALGAVLLAATLALYGVYSRLVGGGAIRMG